MSVILTGDGDRNRSSAQGSFKNATSQTQARYQQESAPISGPNVTRPGKRKTDPEGLVEDYADATTQKRAKPTIRGGLSDRSLDVLKSFPAGETPMPEIKRSSAMTLSGVPVYFHDDHAMSHTFKTNNNLTHTAYLSPDRHGLKYQDGDYMKLVIPEKVPIFTVHHPDAKFKIDPRTDVVSIGELNRQLMDKFKGPNQIDEMEDYIDVHSFLGASLLTTAESDKHGMHVVLLTYTYKGVTDLANLWLDPDLKHVNVGTYLWFVWACRTRGYEREERRAQLQGDEFIPPADTKQEKYLRLEPWCCEHAGEPPLHVRRSCIYFGLPSIFVGRVTRLQRGNPETSQRFYTLAQEILYPKSPVMDHEQVMHVKKLVDRMPIISVSLSKT